MKTKKNRTKLVVLLISMALSLSSLADSPEFPNFFSRWVSTKLTKNMSPTGTVETRSFTRYVFSNQGPFEIGSVTFAKAPKIKGTAGPGAGKDSYDPDFVAGQIGKALGFSSWHKRTQKNAQVFEQYWEGVGRIVRLYIVNDKDTFTTSVAMWRVAYGESVAIETEILQRELTGSLDAKIPWLDKATAALDLLTGDAAYAGPCPPCGSDPFSQLTCASCQAGQLAGPLSNLNTTVNNLNNTIANNAPGATNAINGASAAANNAANAVNGATAAANNATATAQRIANQANTQMTAANQNWHDTNIQLARANDLGEKLTNPFNAFVLGAATGAGVAFGGLLVSAVASGVGALIDGIEELITHKLADAATLKAFEEKVKAYNDLKPAIAKQEKAIDADLTLIRMAQQANFNCSKTPPAHPLPDLIDPDSETCVTSCDAGNPLANCPKGCPQYCKRQCAPPGHCEAECVPQRQQCPVNCNPPLSGGTAVYGRECLIAIVSFKLEKEKKNYDYLTKIQAGMDSANIVGACRDQQTAEAGRLYTTISSDEDLLKTLTKFSHEDVCDGTKKSISGLITAEREIANARGRLTSEDSRRVWRNAQYAQDEEAQNLAKHTLSSAEKQRDTDREKALDLYRSDMGRLAESMKDGPDRRQYEKYLDWKADQVSHCATHSESWDDPNSTALISDGHGNLQHKQITSNGGFWCGIPIIGLPACLGGWNRCQEHHKADPAPAELRGTWWDDYAQRRKRANDAYWISYRQAQTNFDVARTSPIANVPDPVTQARGRQEHDIWLNTLLGEQNLTEQTGRLNSLNDKQTEIMAACSARW